MEANVPKPQNNASICAAWVNAGFNAGSCGNAARIWSLITYNGLANVT